MTKSQILADLPALAVEDRAEVFEHLCDLREADLLSGAGPLPDEKRALDQALADFRRDGNIGEPWREVLRRIRP